ncbi:molecular chaperone TorD family protein [Bradyrhizobium lablabi]|uniref:TorD/DmsD family molecular chaperone n=1 Tax=Bradyrhizobium lablabi TaxID=722472 RepID=UPI001BA7090B|nr:molecular chaperone TorD family protein [Bradyrhizobium lablabi]MBR1122019.1 molecular chaperone TorD family protein [Bradyrhizobium lablabi]
MLELSNHSPSERVVDETDLGRAQQYALLATLLSRSPDERLLSHLARLDGDASPIGLAHRALGEAAARTNEEEAGREYFDLFAGPGRGLLLPYASHYLAGTLYGRPLARLRQTLGLLGIEKTEGNSEPEDHAAILCEVMTGLIIGTFSSPSGADREFFEQHLDPWIGRFFADLERADRAPFYASVGLLGRVFVEVEREAFARSALSV